MFSLRSFSIRLLKFIGWLVFAAVLVSIAGFAWMTVSRTRICTKCLEQRHVVEEWVLGVMVYRDLKETKPQADYEWLFGHPCVHMFATLGRDDGQSHSLLSGVHSNCVFGRGFLDPRYRALEATFDAERRFHDRELALESFALIDTWMPPQMLTPDPYNPSARKQLIASLFGQYLNGAKDVAQWRSVIAAAREGFAHNSGLPGVESYFQKEIAPPWPNLPGVPAMASPLAR